MQPESLIILLILVSATYFLGIRPQQKRKKEKAEMISSLKSGDSVITVEGAIGKIVRVKNDSLILSVNGDRINIEVEKWSISKVY